MATEKLDLIGRALEDLAALESRCALCPRECGVDRRRGAEGFCRSGDRAAVSSAVLHFGEEPLLSGCADWRRQRARRGGQRSGSGTVFFTGCNLKCLFCQNYQISWLQEGRTVEDEELAGMFLNLQAQGALNINLVSPSHMLLPILRALRLAVGRGLDLPVVYNTNGYEKASVVARLQGIVDIYLPDLKYFSPGISDRLSGAADYFERAGPALREMARQQPELVLDQSGAARRGLIVRHLVLPHYHRESLSVLEWIQANLRPGFCLSLMSQYHPCHRAPEEMRRRLTPAEYRAVVGRAEELGFDHVFVQPEAFGPGDHLLPDFKREDPFGWDE
jgi:putative pyruvate formate lyase activating enzyme